MRGTLGAFAARIHSPLVIYDFRTLMEYSKNPREAVGDKSMETPDENVATCVAVSRCTGFCNLVSVHVDLPTITVLDCVSMFVGKVFGKMHWSLPKVY